MCGTKQCGNAYLNAEQNVPDQVKSSPDAEEDDTEQRDAITRRQGLQPGIAFAMVKKQVHDEKNAHQGEAGIEHRVPWREEAATPSSMIMRPPIQVDTANKKGT